MAGELLRDSFRFGVQVKGAHEIAEETGMLYVERNSDGEIISVRRDPGGSEMEQKQSIDDEILMFLSKNGSKDSILHLLSKMDVSIIRILEDLIDLLVDKNIIMFSELPEQAREKLRNRKHLRDRMGRATLIVEDSDVL